MRKLIPLSVFIACLAVALWLGLSDRVDHHLFQAADKILDEGLNLAATAPTVAQKKSADSDHARPTSLENLLANDFRYLAKNNFWGFKKAEIRDVQVLLDSQVKDQKELQKVVNFLYSQFPKSESGKKKLEISLISGFDANAPTETKPSSKKKLLVIQFSVTDVVSQNKIWEMGRTYSY